MKIALIGYGKMGQMIERIAIDRGHQISARLDIGNNANGEGLTRDILGGTDVAIEFTTPETAVRNITGLLDLSIPVVVGTTGWYDGLDEIRQLVIRNDGALVYSPNFALGVNLFFRIVQETSRLLAPFGDFDPFLIEHHHRMKKDAPSGTALKIAEKIRESYGNRTPEAVSVRAGHIPGTHEVGFDSPAETIQLIHTARNREGFASGAVYAAEQLFGRKGCFEFDQLLFG